jgi:hypothetical protein
LPHPALPARPNFSAHLKVIKTAHYETDYLTLFITVEETYGSSFSLQFKISRSALLQDLKIEF